MSKFIFTESQVETIKKSLLKEDTDNQYREECTVDFEYHGLTFNGGEIDDITSPDITVGFNIDMEYIGYGIKDIMVYGFQGQSAIELEIVYYPDNKDEQLDEVITLPLDWDKVIEEEGELGYIGIENRVTISLTNDDEGGLVVDTITVYPKKI